jgi:hypothetical protein
MKRELRGIMVNVNAFQRQEEIKNKFLDLYEKFEPKGLLGLKNKLGITAEDYLNILADIQGIPPNVARRIDYLWEIEFGTVYVPAPMSILDELTEYSIFDAIYKFVAKGESYKTFNSKDVQPTKIEDNDYNGALPRVLPEINNILHKFFKGNFEIEETTGISSGITTQSPEFRKFELEILENTNEIQYFLIYGKGLVIDSIGALPLEKIITVLKREGSWEE